MPNNPLLMSIAKENRLRVKKLVKKYIKNFEATSVWDLDFTTTLDYILKSDQTLRRLKKAILEDHLLCVFEAMKKDHPKEEASKILSLDKEAAETISDNKLNDKLISLWRTNGEEKDAKQPKKKPKKNKEQKELNSNDYKPTIKTSLADLCGIDVCLEIIRDMVIVPLLKPEIFIYSNIKTPKGILLYGPSGCGKTTLANAIAWELNIPFLSISAPSIVSGMSGDSEKKIRDVFEEAKKLAPSIIFIDEIDAITPKRDNAQKEMEKRIVSQLIISMDDLDNNEGKPVIVIGATNRPDSIDPALRRAGRLDKEIPMPIPDENSRKKILETICKKLPFDTEINFEKLARNTPGYVGADLTSLVSNAGIIAIKRFIKDLEISKKDCSQEEFLCDKNVDEISQFIISLREKLSHEALQSFNLTEGDFEVALKTMQPSSKREGFVTLPNVTWSDIGALENVREELRMSVVEPIKHRSLFEKVGITSSAGVLLWGPPGCGKTLLAKAVANESHSNFISVKGPELLNKYVGESERSIRQVFTRAQASSPCIIFFDEIDAICSRRDNSQSEVGSRIVNTFLTELDGLESRKKVFVIAATNRPDIIDPAVLRPGRFDKLLYVGLPVSSERSKILYALTKKTPLSEDVDLEKISNLEECSYYSGADLLGLVREASLFALKEVLSKNSTYKHNTIPKEDHDNIRVSEKHFMQAIKQTTPSVSKKDRKMFEELRAKLNRT